MHQAVRTSIAALLSPALIGYSSGLAVPSAASAQFGAGGSAPCLEHNVPIYHARGFFVQGQMRTCPSGFYDTTTGPNAAAPGERVFISACRVASGQRNAVIRARPNTAYFLNPANEDDFLTTHYEARHGYQWPSVARALPFVPGRVFDLGVYGGRRWYGYGHLAFVPSRINDAYPLNRESVIVSIDGCSFGTADAIVAAMAPPAPSKYVEVIYYQPNEGQVVFRRAFVPTYQRAEIASEWAQLTRAHPVFEPDPTGRILAWVAVAGMLALVTAFSQSSVGQQMARDRAECLRRQQNYGGIMIC